MAAVGLIEQAREAIAAGADPEAVRRRLVQAQAVEAIAAGAEPLAVYERLKGLGIEAPDFAPLREALRVPLATEGAKREAARAADVGRTQRAGASAAVATGAGIVGTFGSALKGFGRLIGEVVDPELQPEGETALERWGDALMRWAQERVEEHTEPGFATRGLPQAVGSMLGMGLTFAADPFVGAALGAAAQAGEQIARAEAKGATREQQRTEMLTGFALGATEFVPLARVFRRFERAMPELGWARRLKEGGVQALAEGLQEAFTEFGANISAAEISKYDPERSPLENLREAFTTGASVGGLMALLAIALGVKIPAKAPVAEELRREVERIQEGIREGKLPGKEDQAKLRSLLEAMADELRKENPGLRKLEEYLAEMEREGGIVPAGELAGESGAEIAKAQKGVEAAEAELAEAAEARGPALDPDKDLTVQVEQEGTRPVWLPGTRRAVTRSLVETLRGKRWDELPQDTRDVLVEILRGTFGPDNERHSSIKGLWESAIIEGDLDPTARVAKLTKGGAEAVHVQDAKELESAKNKAIYVVAEAGNPLLQPRYVLARRAVYTVVRALLPRQRVAIALTKPDAAGSFTRTALDKALVVKLPRTLAQQLMNPDTAPEALGILVHEVSHAYFSAVMPELPKERVEALAQAYLRFLNDLHEGRQLTRFYNWPGSVPPGLREIVPSDVAADMLAYMYSASEWVARTVQMQVAGGLLEHPVFKAIPKEVMERYRQGLERLGRDFYGTLLPGRSAGTYVRMVLDSEFARAELDKVLQEVVGLVKPENLKRFYRLPNETQRALEAWAKKQGKVAAFVEGSAKPPSKGEMAGWSPDGKNWRYVPARFSFWQKHFGPLLVTLQRNMHLPGVGRYLQGVTTWATTRSQWMTHAQERLREWRRLALTQREHAALEEALYEITLESDEKGRRLKKEELLGILRKKGLDRPHVVRFVDEVLADFRRAITDFYNTLIAATNKRLATDPERRAAEVEQLQKEKRRLINRNYFPLSRFGEYFVELRDAEGKVVLFETFELKRDRDARLRELRRQGKAPAAGKLTRAEREYMGLPFEVLKRLKEVLELDPEQQAALDAAINRMSPGQSFRKHLIRRKRVAGWATAARRTYAAYFRSFANQLARMKGAEVLGEALDELGDYVRKAEKTPGVVADRERDLLVYLQEHRAYLMNPRSEWESARALTSLWYLGAVPKSAFVNLTQLALGTYPWLAARFGDAAAVREIVRAMRDLKAVWKRRTTGPEGKLDADLNAALYRAQQEGVLSETFAGELAATAEGTPFGAYGGETVSGERVALGVQKAAEVAMTFFRLAEEINRRVTFVAAWRLGQQKGLAGPELYAFAKDAVYKTQFVYSKWNRAAFQRGKKSVLFVFWSYWTNFLWFLRDQGGPTAARTLLMLAALGGLQSLPFAEDFMDLIEALGTRLRRMLGYKDPKVDIRTDIRRYVREVGLNPDWVMTGLLGNLGPFTMQPSISMGRVVPGMQLLASFIEGRPPEAAQLTQQIASASAGPAIVEAMLEAVTSDDPDLWKRFEKMLPQALKNVSAAVRRGVRGEETMPSGAALVTFDVENPEELAELIGKALGFESARLARERELRWAVKERLYYYLGWRQRLLADLEFAYRTGRDVGKVMRKIWEYNRSVPHPVLSIRPGTVARSIKGRIKRQRMEELLGTPERMAIPLAREIEPLYGSGRR